MKRLTLFIICAIAVASMGQLKISGYNPSKINGSVPSVWSGVDTDFGSESEPDTWSPSSGALAYLDSVEITSEYNYPIVYPIPNTRLLIIGYTVATGGGGDRGRWLETRIVSETDTVGEVIDSWRIADDYPLGFNQSFVTLLDTSNYTQFLVEVMENGQDLDGVDEGLWTPFFFTTEISTAGIFSKTKQDSFYLTAPLSADNAGSKEIAILNANDSLFVFMSAVANDIGYI